MLDAVWHVTCHVYKLYIVHANGHKHIVSSIDAVAWCGNEVTERRVRLVTE